MIQIRMQARTAEVNSPAMMDQRKIRSRFRRKFLPPIPGSR